MHANARYNNRLSCRAALNSQLSLPWKRLAAAILIQDERAAPQQNLYFNVIVDNVARGQGTCRKTLPLDR